MLSEISFRVSKKEKKKKKNNPKPLNKRKTKVKEQKTTLELASLAPASEKSLSDNYRTLYN